MHENQSDQQFDNSGHGQYEEDIQNMDNTSSRSQTQSDRTDVENSENVSIEEDEAGVNVSRSAERHPMVMEEYERSRLQAIPKNNNFLSIIEEGENDEDNDLDIDEEDFDEEDLEDDDNEESISRDIDDELLELGDSPYPDRNGFRNDVNKNPDEDAIN